MGLTDVLATWAARRAHVLIVEAPGGWLVRTRVEREVRDRGWRLAESPADADVLAVCGAARGGIAQAVGRVWDQMPGPRARVDVDHVDRVRSGLTDAAALLVDREHQRGDARHRSLMPDADRHGGAEHGGAEHGGAEHGGAEHGGAEHGGAEHGGGGMAPGGIPLAGGTTARDGLDLDVLHLRLGPVLRHWPAGLVLRCCLQGDVITAAEASVVDGVPPAADEPVPVGSGPSAARRCDNVAGLLALAQWEDGATAARQVRDALLTDALPEAAAELDRFWRTIRRSWLLRWSLRGVGPVSHADAGRHDLPRRLCGDTYDRLLAMLARAQEQATGHPAAHDDEASAAAALRAVPYLVTGLNLATARLVVASLDFGRMVPEAEAHA